MWSSNLHIEVLELFAECQQRADLVYEVWGSKQTAAKNDYKRNWLKWAWKTRAEVREYMNKATREWRARKMKDPAYAAKEREARKLRKQRQCWKI